jgi:hypothetical protein
MEMERLDSPTDQEEHSQLDRDTHKVELKLW